jgi:hypothetical protein
MGEATEDMIIHANKMGVVVVCSCYVLGGFFGVSRSESHTLPICNRDLQG